MVSGDDAATLDAVANLYSSVVTAGVHRATNIKVAEAAKVIENTKHEGHETARACVSRPSRFAFSLTFAVSWSKSLGAHFPFPAW